MKPTRRISPYHIACRTLLAAVTFVAVSLAQAAPAPHIAVILPLKGKSAKAAQFVRDGFIAAYYDSLAKKPQTPALRIYDSTEQSISDTYDLAIREGAVAVAGPLDKEQVRQLDSRPASLPVPTLALNQIESARHTNLRQLSLSPETEIARIVEAARANGFSQALIIAQNDDTNSRIRKLFADSWQNSGGVVADTLNVTGRSNVIKDVRTLVFPTTPKRKTGTTLRADGDFIFIATNSNIARQIKPALNDVGAGSLPLFAISGAVDASGSEVQLQDLNGIFYNEHPWIIAPSALHDTLSTLLPAGSSSFDRLYAFGVDAWSILEKWRTGETPFPYNGMTGVLTLEDDGKIKREPLWAQVRNGRITSTDPKTSR